MMCKKESKLHTSVSIYHPPKKLKTMLLFIFLLCVKLSELIVFTTNFNRNILNTIQANVREKS